MKSKGILILIAVIVVLAGYAFFDYRSENLKTAEKAEQAKLMTLNKDQVSEISIEKNGKVFLLKRSPDGWKIEKPIQDWADNDGVEIFISTAQSESALDVAKEGKDIDWALYGLDKPLAKITFKGTGGQTVSYEVSSKKNFEQNTFLRKNQEDKVYVVSATWQARANKDQSEFRDKRLLRHQIASVEQLDLKTETTQLHLKMKDGQWFLPENPQQKLDQNKVRQLLQNIVDAKAADFISDKAPTKEEKKKYFLTKPNATLDLQLGDKKWTAVFGQSPNHELYVWVSDPVFLLKLEPGTVDKIFRVKAVELYESAKGQPKGTVPTGFNPKMKLETKVLPADPKAAAPQEKK